MTQPGGPYHYPPQYPPPWGPPPPRRRGKGVLIGVLVTVLLLGLSVGGLWLWEELDDPPPPPPVDASDDLEKAPIGCAMFTEEEVAPYIPGRMDYEEGGANAGARESYDLGQCSWNNLGRLAEDGVRGAHVIVTSYVYHANTQLSGVDRAKEHLESRVRDGVSVHVEGAEDALLTEQRRVDWSVHIDVRYRNVIYSIDYSNQTEGANVKRGATELATVAIGKVVPEED